MKYRIDPEKFGGGSSLYERTKSREDSNAKFNIKVRRSDLRLIDHLAEHAGTSRATILNSMVRVILVEMLQEMRNDDEDSAALLALYADENLGKSERSTDGWSAALFGLESYEATSYWLKHEQDDFVASEKYWNLKRRIHGLKI